MDSNHRQHHPVGSAAAFRPQPKQYVLHPLERTLAGLVITLLIFLPWALGGMKLWAQWIALGLASLAFVVSLLPRTYDDRYHAAGNMRLYMWPKLLHFPIFWLGLVYFALIVCQILNPAWSYRSSSAGWWLEGIDYVTWLPHGIEGTPFAKMNGWRTIMIQGGAWLLVCALWVGVTRRRTARLILYALAVNGVLIAASVIFQRISGSQKYLFLWDPPSRTFAGAFIYKNHAGAYLLLILAVANGLAWWQAERARQQMSKSHPGFLFIFFTLLTAIALLLTYARATSVIAGIFLTAVLLFYLVRVLLQKSVSSFLVAILWLSFVGVGILGLSSFSSLSGPVRDNFDKLLNEDRPFSIGWRQHASAATLDMARDDVVWGHGIGGFRFLFPLYQQHYKPIWIGFEWSGPNIVERRLYWEHTHNDYLEYIAESGLFGATLFMAGMACLLSAMSRFRLFSQPAPLIIYTGPGLVALNAAVDFPLHNPAVLFTTVAVVALALRWAQLSRRA